MCGIAILTRINSTPPVDIIYLPPVLSTQRRTPYTNNSYKKTPCLAIHGSPDMTGDWSLSPVTAPDPSRRRSLSACINAFLPSDWIFSCPAPIQSPFPIAFAATREH